MFSPNLTIPEQEIITEAYRGVVPDVISIQNWLNQRDHGDVDAFLNMLISINRVKCEPAVRMSLMAILDSEIKKELDKLFKQTSMIAFPISEEYQSLINTLQQLLLESSVAYQIVIHNIAARQEYVNQYLGNLIPEALFMALFYLSRLLVERFQCYLSEPKLVWQELNQLYLLSERIGAEDDMVHRQSSIKLAYLQISILKILNPYRMMRLEARKIYHLLADWVEHCEIISYAQQLPENNFVVNLLDDTAPHYFDSQSDAKDARTTDVFEGRIVTMNKLRIFLDMELAEIERQKQDHVFSYQARIHNEMLQRIDNEMSLHEERSEERILSGNEIKLVSGLRACHYFISHRKTFKPQEEIDAQLEKKLEATQAEENIDGNINLITLLEEAKLMDKKNPMGELQSVNPFFNETDLVGDEWEHIYSNSVINANFDASEKQFVHSLKEENWKQRNESRSGMLLVSKNDIEMPIAVGMLVAYRLSVEKVYCLAIVKWLRVNPRKGIAIGIHLIAVESRAIAVKGESGAGGGGQFQQAFLISKKVGKKAETQLHLIVPSGVYDKGSTLKVWHNEKLNYVKIIKVLLATDSFERVTFEVIGKKNSSKRPT